MYIETFILVKEYMAYELLCVIWCEVLFIYIYIYIDRWFVSKYFVGNIIFKQAKAHLLAQSQMAWCITSQH